MYGGLSLLRRVWLWLGGGGYWPLGEGRGCRHEGDGEIGSRANAKIEGRRKKWRARVGGERRCDEVDWLKGWLYRCGCGCGWMGRPDGRGLSCVSSLDGLLTPLWSSSDQFRPRRAGEHQWGRPTTVACELGSNRSRAYIYLVDSWVGKGCPGEGLDA